MESFTCFVVVLTLLDTISTTKLDYSHRPQRHINRDRFANALALELQYGLISPLPLENSSHTEYISLRYPMNSFNNNNILSEKDFLLKNPGYGKDQNKGSEVKQKIMTDIETDSLSCKKYSCLPSNKREKVKSFLKNMFRNNAPFNKKMNTSIFNAKKMMVPIDGRKANRSSAKILLFDSRHPKIFSRRRNHPNLFLDQSTILSNGNTVKKTRSININEHFKNGRQTSFLDSQTNIRKRSHSLESFELSADNNNLGFSNNLGTLDGPTVSNRFQDITVLSDDLEVGDINGLGLNKIESLEENNSKSQQINVLRALSSTGNVLDSPEHISDSHVNSVRRQRPSSKQLQKFSDNSLSNADQRRLSILDSLSAEFESQEIIRQNLKINKDNSLEFNSIEQSPNQDSISLESFSKFDPITNSGNQPRDVVSLSKNAVLQELNSFEDISDIKNSINNFEEEFNSFEDVSDLKNSIENFEFRSIAVNENEASSLQSFDYQNEELSSRNDRLLDDLVGVHPLLSTVPASSFRCEEQRFGGYFADPESQCQAFHICHNGQLLGSFLCPNGTLFHQRLFVCDWWYNVRCQDSQDSYHLNRDIGAQLTSQEIDLRNNEAKIAAASSNDFDDQISRVNGISRLGSLEIDSSADRITDFDDLLNDYNEELNIIEDIKSGFNDFNKVQDSDDVLNSFEDVLEVDTNANNAKQVFAIDDVEYLYDYNYDDKLRSEEYDDTSEDYY